MTTRIGRVSDYMAGIWLIDLQTRAVAVGLSKVDPYSVIDPLTVEPQDTGYARARTGWIIQGRVMRNTATLKYTGMPVGTQLVAFTLWDALANGTLLASVPFTPITLTVIGGPMVYNNDLFIGMDL